MGGLVNPPIINSFTSDVLTTNPGGSIILQWSTNSAYHISINNGVGDVSSIGLDYGWIEVFPTTNSNYILTATNPLGSVGSDIIYITIAPSTTITTGGTVLHEKYLKLIRPYAVSLDIDRSDMNILTLTPSDSLRKYSDIVVEDQISPHYNKTVIDKYVNDKILTVIDIPSGSGGSGGSSIHITDPVITVQPVAVPQVPQGADEVYTVTATGTGTLNYHWEITNTMNGQWAFLPGDSNTVTIQAQDRQQYIRVVVFNDNGSIGSTIITCLAGS